MHSISTLTDGITPGTHEVTVKARVSNALANGQFGYGASGHPSLLIQSMIL